MWTLCYSAKQTVQLVSGPYKDNVDTESQDMYVVRVHGPLYLPLTLYALYHGLCVNPL